MLDIIESPAKGVIFTPIDLNFYSILKISNPISSAVCFLLKKNLLLRKNWLRVCVRLLIGCSVCRNLWTFHPYWGRNQSMSNFGLLFTFAQIFLILACELHFSVFFFCWFSLSLVMPPTLQLLLTLHWTTSPKYSFLKGRTCEDNVSSSILCHLVSGSTVHFG